MNSKKGQLSIGHRRTRRWAVLAAAISMLGATLVGTAPAYASTKLTCNIGYIGWCSTGSLYPYCKSSDCRFYLGVGSRSTPVRLEVVDSTYNSVEYSITIPAPSASAWHGYVKTPRFKSYARYHLVATCPYGGCLVTASIENRAF